MQPVGTVVTLGAAPARDAARLDAGALACERIDGDFARVKQAEAGSLLFVLLEEADDPALAAASKALGILRRRGGGESLVVLPPAEANPGPQGRARMDRAARLTGACALLPVRTTWADAVRCLAEPLAVFGLVGVDAKEIHALFARPRAALLHADVREVRPDARDVLVSHRLDASLRELDETARAVAGLAPGAKLIIAAPEADRGPRVLAASLF